MESLLEYRKSFAFLTFLIGLKMYYKMGNGRCRSRRRLDGKTAIITGGNSGIGKETALDFARRGARVILACRNVKKAEAVMKDIVRETGNSNIEVRPLDLSSFASVRDFAKSILESEKALHILVNNAGMPGNNGKRSKDGIELTIQINHLGHVLLTYLLTDLLRKSAPARVVFVSSLVHEHCTRLDPDDLRHDKLVPFSHMTAYANSKLCNVLTAMHLAKLLQGTGVTVNSLHPGAVMTDIWDKIATSTWSRLVLRFIFGNFMKDSKEGAQTTIHVAVCEEVDDVTGKYFSDCKVKLPSKEAQDECLARRVWEKSCELVGVAPSLHTTAPSRL